jgi:hypothetical protein
MKANGNGTSIVTRAAVTPQQDDATDADPPNSLDPRYQEVRITIAAIRNIITESICVSPPKRFIIFCHAQENCTDAADQ